MTARSVRIALFFAATCTLIGLASCSEDGVTSNCPALPLYQTFALGDASPPDAGSVDSPATKAALAKAAAEGCVTLPTTSVVASGGGEAGVANAASGGSGGKGGSGGSAGHAGRSSAGGSTNTENAGAAGSN